MWFVSRGAQDPLAEAAAPFAGEWQRRAFWIAGLWVLAIIAYRDTAGSMVDTWVAYDTYSHGFLILPIALWLIWERRATLLIMPPVICYPALLAVALAGLGWFAASLAYVQAVQQFALVGLLIALVCFCIGGRATREIAFPLAYLFFAVPVGEVFVPPMMELTATQTVELVRLSGIPVYREGLYFSLPSGNWSVVKACSGVRYLIASLALGTIYAYLTYRSLTRRLLFILAAIVVPIVANVLRAYMIVMLGHLSDMTIATGVDHLIYGWVFFGFVMLLMFWIGSWFADTETDAGEPRSPGAGAAVPAPADGVSPRGLIAPLAAAGALVLLFPLLVNALEQRTVSIPEQELLLPAMPAPWTPTDTSPWSWRPPFYGADKQLHQFFERDGRVYGVSIGLYLQQRQDAEMISYRNGLIDKETREWKLLGQEDKALGFDDDSFDVLAATLSGEGHALELYTWYDIGDYQTASKYAAKLHELLEKATFRSTASARVLVYGETVAGAAMDGSALDRFLLDAKPRIEAAIAQLTAGAR